MQAGHDGAAPRPPHRSGASGIQRYALEPLIDKLDRPDDDPLGLRRVLAQAAHDLYGTKDVQDAITASYVWLADQIGHLALGLIPTLLYCWLSRRVGVSARKGTHA